MPYLFVMVAFAIYEKQWKQSAAWSGAFLMFAIAFASHIGQANSLYKSGDFVSSSWLALGGWSFAIASANGTSCCTHCPMRLWRSRCAWALWDLPELVMIVHDAQY